MLNKTSVLSGPLSEAIKKAEELNNWIDEQKKMAENQALLANIQSLLRGRNIPNIVQSGRKYVDEEDITEITGKKHIQKRIFIFNDSVLFVIVLGNYYVFDKLVYLHFCELIDSGGPDVTLKVAEEAVIRIRFLKTELKDKWKAYIEPSIASLHWARQSHTLRASFKKPKQNVINSNITSQGKLLVKNKDGFWYQHWLVLESGKLFFYYDIGSLHEFDSIVLSGFFITTQTSQNEKDRWVLHLYNSQSDEYLIATDTKEEHKRWLTEIKNYTWDAPQKAKSKSTLTRSTSATSLRDSKTSSKQHNRLKSVLHFPFNNKVH